MITSLSKIILLFLITSSILISSCKREFKGEGKINREWIKVDGERRKFKVYYPQNFDENKLYPTVIAMHGRFGNSRNTQKLMMLNPIADEMGFIIVYPDGYKRSWNDGRPDAGPASEDGINDVKFISELIDYLIEDFSVHPDSIYATGMSNGGFMSMRLACELNDKIAAFSTVTGSISADFEEWCDPQKSVPVMLIAGTVDPLVPYNGGGVGKNNTQVLGFEELFDFWGNHNQCFNAQTTALPDQFDDQTTVEKMYYDSCSEASVILFKVIGGGHTWPSGGQYLNEDNVGVISEEIDASKEMLQFFRNYSLQ